MLSGLPHTVPVGMPGMPPMFQLPMLNPVWMEMYAKSLGGFRMGSQASPEQRKRGFNIADILSEEKQITASHKELEMTRVVNHPYFPAVPAGHQHGAMHMTERSSGGVMRQCRNKRVRTIFTPEQLEQLEKIFEKQQYMVGTERYYLASKLNLSEAQVKVWFQNRRIKWRKQSGLDGVRNSELEDYHANGAEFSDTCSESGFSETGSL